MSFCLNENETFPPSIVLFLNEEMAPNSAVSTK